MTIEEILQLPTDECIAQLKKKSFYPPSWETLRQEYDPMKHSIMTDPTYINKVNPDGTIDIVSRTPMDLQRLAVKRMTELVFGIPVKRIYRSTDDRQKEVAKVIEKIFQRNRIDSVNIERGNMLFASCEVMTLWYAVNDKNNIYGVNSDMKIRCRNFSPMSGDELYPLFDEQGDYIAMSVEYSRTDKNKTIKYFDTYTKDKHIRWENKDTEWTEVVNEDITVGKNPTLYCVRSTPIWENTSNLVNEMEWALSRNGNYIRKNSKPVLSIAASEAIPFGNEKSENTEFRSVIQIPEGGNVQYVTWPQAIDNLKFYIQELRNLFFMELQLPDWSYENMKSTPMSGEARKQLFIDSQLKVKDESGRILEMLDREVNVVKAFVKGIMPGYEKDIDALQVETEITPFSINDESETIANLVTATGGKAILSQKEAIETLGWSNDSEETMKQIAEETALANAELSI